MTPYIEEAQLMLRLAESDLEAFRILSRHPGAPLAPTCFHAQQCVEKALKAALMTKQVYFRRTHDLEEIVNLLIHANIIPPFGVEDYGRLSPFAVELRYGDHVIPQLDLAEAGHLAGQTLSWAGELVAASE